ncbi:MAG: CdaR family protein, partial [Myxococcota bacterium]|nr:CdaR family protein [Myxococcota bacterium]
LGRTAGRTSRQQPAVPPPEDPAPPERGVVRRFLHGALFENVGLKFLSMVLAVTVFLLVNTDKDREITVRVGVRYEYPADKVLVSEQLDEVRVTIKGPWRRLREFDERELGRIRLDLASAPTGEVAITSDMVSLPPGLSVTSISPRSVRVAFDKRVEKTVEVNPAVTGRPQHGYVVAEIKAVPPTIKVRGGERLLAALSAIRTSEVSLEGRTETFETLAELAPPDGVSVDPTLRVAVNIRIEEELVTRKAPSLIVTLQGEGVDPNRWTITPPQVEVVLTGTLLAVEKARSAIAAYVKVSPAERTTREVQVGLDGLPPGVGVRISPERVKVRPVR